MQTTTVQVKVPETKEETQQEPEPQEPALKIGRADAHSVFIL